MCAVGAGLAFLARADSARKTSIFNPFPEAGEGPVVRAGCDMAQLVVLPLAVLALRQLPWRCTPICVPRIPRLMSVTLIAPAEPSVEVSAGRLFVAVDGWARLYVFCCWPRSLRAYIVAAEAVMTCTCHPFSEERGCPVARACVRRCPCGCEAQGRPQGVPPSSVTLVHC